jgi:hypothetical protein
MIGPCGACCFSRSSRHSRPRPARGATWLDPDARGFTLQWRDGPAPGAPTRDAGRLRPLPDGSVIFASDLLDPTARPRLWRLRLDGRIGSMAWAGVPLAHAAEARGTVLLIRRGETTIERLRLSPRRRTVVADLAAAPGFRDFGEAPALAALADGSIAVATLNGAWRVVPGRPITQFPRQLAGAPALLVLAGGALAAVLSDGSLATVSAGGAFRGLDVRTVGAVAATGDGRLLTTTADPLVPGRVALTVIDPLGATVRLPSAPVTGRPGGDGGTLAETPWQPPRSMAVAADGSFMLLTSGDRLRAAVPADRPRPRVALDPATRATLRHGRVGYRAGAAGRLALELRSGGALITRASGRTSGGAGELLSRRRRLPGSTTSGCAWTRVRGDRSRALLVVDEAGMVPTRQLAELLDHVERAADKLVLVGDDRQLPAIEAGGALRGLIQRGLAVEFGENVRQANGWRGGVRRGTSR